MSKKKATKKAPRRKPRTVETLAGRIARLEEAKRKKERDAYENSLRVPMVGTEFSANVTAPPLIQRVSPSDPQPGYEIASNTERMMRNMDLVATALTTQAEASRLLAVALLDSNIRTTR